MPLVIPPSVYDSEMHLFRNLPVQLLSRQVQTVPDSEQLSSSGFKVLARLRSTVWTLQWAGSARETCRVFTVSASGARKLPKGDWKRQKASCQPCPWAWTWFPWGPKRKGCSFRCTLLWWLRIRGVPLLSRPAPPLHIRVPLAIKVSVSAVANGYASAMSRT